MKIDLVPAKRQPQSTYNHSIYRSKAGTWTKTNIHMHILLIKKSGRINEIRAIKIWRNLHNLHFPSFYLELSVINALRGAKRFQLSRNFIKVLEYFCTDFADARILDPSNSKNVISDDLSMSEKKAIIQQACSSLMASSWDEIIW